MEIENLSKTIKAHIGNAHTDQAIAALLDFLQQDSRYDHLESLTIQVQSEFSKLRSDQISGVLSDDQSALAFNRLNKRILGIVEKLEKGDLGEDSATTGKSGGLRPVWIIGGILVIAIVALVLFLNKKPPVAVEQTVSVATSECPALEVPEGFNVLVANFVKLRGPDARPEVQIVREINALCKKNGINAGATLTDSQQITTTAQAEKTCRNCKTQLVVYGTYETIKDDSLFINVNYKLITDMKLSALQAEGESGFKAVQTISSIDADGELLSGISNVIKGIFGIVAISNDNVAMAAPFLWDASQGNLSKTDTVLHRLAADCFVATNQPEKALLQYNAFFDKGGESVIARSNRAAINFVKGNFDAVVNDANVNIAKNQADTTSLWLRSAAFSKLQQWEDAYKDLKVLQKVKPDDSAVIQKSAEVEEKIDPSIRNTKSINTTQLKYRSGGGG